MNPSDEKTAADDDQRFDLLVDGELSDRERRELLCGLDDRPGGWRRCALAFLQAQAWREDFAALLRPGAARPAGARAARRPWLNRYGGTLMAMAASFLVALVLASLLRGPVYQPAPGGSLDMQLAGSTPATPTQQAAQPQSPLPEALPASDVPGSPWRLVQFASSGSPQGARQTIQLPAMVRDKLDADWLKDQPPAIPARVLEALQHTGYQVSRHTELVPYRMRDGQQLVVPVDNYDVHYVGRPAL